MSEPTLQGIEDYNTLSGQKRRVVWAVIISGLIMGAVFAGAKIYFGDVDDAIVPTESIGKIPVR